MSGNPINTRMGVIEWAMLIGLSFLNERLGTLQFIGMAVIAAGLLVIDGRLFAWFGHNKARRVA